MITLAGSLYEKRIDESFDEFFDLMRQIHPDIDKEDDEVFNAAASLTVVDDETYFAAGVLVGFQLYKNMEREYMQQDVDLKAILDKAKSLRQVL